MPAIPADSKAACAAESTASNGLDGSSLLDPLSPLHAASTSNADMLASREKTVFIAVHLLERGSSSNDGERFRMTPEARQLVTMCNSRRLRYQARLIFVASSPPLPRRYRAAWHRALQ